MKKLLTFLSLSIFSLIIISQAISQPGKGQNLGSMTQLYDSTTVETVEGNIEKVETVKSGYGRFDGILLHVKVKKKVKRIYIAPAWYLDEQKIEFKKGKSIKVTGSKVTYLEKSLIITKDITFNKKNTTIRKKNGIPVWAGKRRGMGRRWK